MRVTWRCTLPPESSGPGPRRRHGKLPRGSLLQPSRKHNRDGSRTFPRLPGRPGPPNLPRLHTRTSNWISATISCTRNPGLPSLLCPNPKVNNWILDGCSFWSTPRHYEIWYDDGGANIKPWAYLPDFSLICELRHTGTIVDGTETCRMRNWPLGRIRTDHIARSRTLRSVGPWKTEAWSFKLQHRSETNKKRQPVSFSSKMT